MTDLYDNPLITRYAGREMATLFSEQTRISLFRKLWVALAEAEKELGLNITDAQISDLKKFQNVINFDRAAELEKITRHDVMAHVKAYGEQAVSAAPIIHLGATSCYVTDNADIIIYRDALKLVNKKILNVINRLAKFADKYKDLPTLGFTHFQPAQPTTVGKRAALWIQDLMLDYENIESVIEKTMLRGVKGTTGTQASFFSLFDGSDEKVKKLETAVVKKMGFKKAYALSGQTYTRKYDYTVLAALSGAAQSAYKFSNDLRLLQHLKEVEEPFEKGQIGSSAMAYKRNPMRSERISSLCRYAVSMPVNAAVTAGTQWMERTLDDSANRRIVMAQMFLSVDGALQLYFNIAENMKVYEKVIQKHLDAELPFMATEEILMACVKAGGDRQELHEKIRVHSMAAAAVVKEQGGDNDLISRILSDKSFAAIHGNLKKILKPENFTGRAAKQTEEYLTEEVYPLLNKNKALLDLKDTVTV